MGFAVSKTLTGPALQFFDRGKARIATPLDFLMYRPCLIGFSLKLSVTMFVHSGSGRVRLAA